MKIIKLGLIHQNHLLMTLIIIGISLLFIGIAFILTEDNAQYLLSGYNTMTKEEQKKVNIKGFIPYFKQFHIFLGISCLVLSLSLTYAASESTGAVFLVIYPIAAYLFFFTQTRRYFKETQNNKIGIYILTGTLFFVTGSMLFGLKEDSLTVSKDNLKFDGIYGETIKPADIHLVLIVSELPEIKWKSNGFALEKIRKGYFKTKDGEKIKLILNSQKPTYLLIIKTNGSKIYYSAKEKSSESVRGEIQQAFPALF
jgi:hypothetical protein